jgi:WD40 repeat protein/tetratricopeptide (TPR) repeat protein
MNNQFKDLFISYGRRESLCFVGRLHQRLKLAGYDAWFDKANIPDGDDYAQRINHGIESAHNFVYVMAPRCMTSPYCLIELEYARLLGKRVIPINHKVIFQTASQELSDGDKKVMSGFYQLHNLLDQNIQTTQDVLDRSHALIGRTDWLDAKENLSDDDCQRITEWAGPYENNWAKHDDINYLKSFEFPVFGETIDTLDGVVERIITVIERQTDYVHKHTEILANALHWQKNQKATQYLLVGKERTAAEEWLLTDFLPPKQPPCQPSALVCELICEARKNAENLMTDIFICYDVEHDKAIRDSIVQSLSRYAKTTWRHDYDIKTGDNYEGSIEQGIENADNLLYFISPHAIVSEFCQRELAHALKYNKRIVPLLIAPTPESEIPATLHDLQYIDFTDNTSQADYNSDIDDILNILQQDQKYYEQHKVLLARALQWKTQNYKPSFLLRGHHLENAQTWLRLNNNRKQHPPLNLHKQLITASEAAKGQLGTEVFISYSRKDGDFARQLNLALQEAGKTTWFDQESISTGVDFEKEIFKGIASSDNFVFVISPDAIQSDYCEREVNYAASQHKRFITILHRETDPTIMPKALRVINWIDFANSSFEKSFLELVQAIELDREYAHQHTVLQQRATEWNENSQCSDFLLNMTACVNAEQWLKTATEEQKQPKPTTLQQHFIQQSRKAIDAAEQKARKRRNIIFSAVTGGMVFAMILALFAFIQMEEAKKQEQLAIEAKQEVEEQKNEALRTQSLLLSDLARQQTEKGDAANGILLALEALPKDMSQPNKPYVAPAEKQLYQAVSKLRERTTLTGSQRSIFFHLALSPDGQHAVTASKEKRQQTAVLFGHQNRVWFAEFSLNGQKVVTASQDKTARIWNAITGEPLLILYGHQGNIWSAKFSPDSQKIVTASEDMTARLWDANTGQQLAVLIGHKSIIKYAEFSPDGRHIVTASEDNTAGLWDTKTGELITVFAGHSASIWYAIFTADGQRVITASGDKTARLWDVRSGELLRIFSGHENLVYRITISPDQQRIATVSYDKTVRLWDINFDKEPIILQGHEDKVWNADFSPDGQQIVTASEDKTARLWDSNTGQQLAVLSGHIGTLTDAKFLMNGQQIMTIGRDTMRFWEVNPLKPLLVLSGHTDTINHSIFSHDGQQIVTASKDNTIRFWDANTGKRLNVLKGHTANVTYVELSPNGQRLLSVSKDKTARLWDMKTGQQLVVFKGHEKRVRHATFSADGLRVVTASDDQTARLWEANTGKPLLVLEGHTGKVVRVAFSPDNQRIATASWDNTARIWDAHTGKALFTLSHKHKVEKVTFSPDGQQVLTASADWTARLWNVQNGQQIVMFAHRHAVWHAAFSPDGKHVITGSKDHTARLWSTAKLKRIAILAGHKDDVIDAVFSFDGKKIMTVSQDNTARLWDTETAQPLAVMLGHTDDIYHAAFSPDRTKVVTSSRDKTARIWHVFATTQELIDYANQIVPHCFTQDQREQFFLSPDQSHALIETGENFSKNGQFGKAVIQFQQALQQAPCLKFEPIHKAQQIATHTLMQQGHELVKEEQFEAALDKFKRVQELNPRLNFEPNNQVRKITALALMDKSHQLAQQGDIKAAVAGFQTALKMDSNLNFEPSKKAQQIVANRQINKGVELAQQKLEGILDERVMEAFQKAFIGEINLSLKKSQKAPLDKRRDLFFPSPLQQIRANYLIRTGAQLAQSGEIEKAIAIYEKIPKQVSISAYFWNRLCWYGSLHQKAFEVMDFCAKAVELEPENEWFRRASGMNNALIGDSQAAIEDFQFFIAKTPYNQLNRQAQGWIRTLRRCKNPFSPTVQKLLLLHGTTIKQPPKWCANDLNSSEQVICNNQKLWELENQNRNSYYRWRDSLPNFEDRDSAQKELMDWLAYRNEQCLQSVESCLKVYEKRVRLLNARYRNKTWQAQNYSD